MKPRIATGKTVMQETMREIFSAFSKLNFIFSIFSKIFEPSSGSQGRRFRIPITIFISEKYVPLKIIARIKFTKGPAKAQKDSLRKLNLFVFFLSILIPNGVNRISSGVSPNKSRQKRWPDS